MKTRFLKQLKVLLWKNYKLKTRRPILFIIEIAIPLALCIILGEIRKTKPPTVMMPSYHYATGLPSAGIIPFIQGLPVVGCWDYEKFNVEYYPLPSWFSDLPNIEKAYRKVTAWPLVFNETNRDPFKSFLISDLELSNREALALTVSTVNLTRGLSYDQLIKAFDTSSNKEGDLDPGTLLIYILNEDIDSLFNAQLKAKACKNELSDMMDFPADTTDEELSNINSKICSMSSAQEEEFKAYTKPDQEELQRETKVLYALIKSAFYPVPIGASAPVFDIYRRALQLDYRSIRTTLAIIKYYLCPTLKFDMEHFFISLEKDMRAAESEGTPPLYPHEDPGEENKSPQQPHRRSANANIFNKDRKENGTESPLAKRSEAEVVKQELETLTGEKGNFQAYISNDYDSHSEQTKSHQQYFADRHLQEEGIHEQDVMMKKVKKSLESTGEEISVLESEIWYTLTEGKIYYSPTTPLAQSIIKEANVTFAKIDEIIQGLGRFNLKIQEGIEAMGDPTKAYVIAAGVKALANFMGIPVPENITGLLVNTSTTLSKVTKLPNYFSLDRWVGFETERELEFAGIETETSNNSWLWAGITFEDLFDNRTTLPENVRYKVRVRSGYVPPLRDVRYTYWRSYPYDFLWDRQYWVYGFIYLQDMIESGIARFIGNGTIEWPGSYSQMFPYPCWLNDKYLYVISRTLPMCMVVSWVYIVAMSAKRIVYEKELRLKEVMQVMGLRDAVHWWGWGITLLASTSITNVFLVLILKYGEITIYTNGLLLYLLLTLFTLCNIVFCFLVSVFFIQSKLAAVVSAVMYYTLYLPYTIASLQEENMDFWMKMMASCSSTTAFGFGMLHIARYEEQGVGLQWDNLAVPPDAAQQFSFLHCIVMMVADFFSYLLLVLYFQKVIPHKHGATPKPWYFPLSWCCKPLFYWYRQIVMPGNYRQVLFDDPYTDLISLIQYDSTDAELSSADIEAVAKHLRPGVELVNISKHYGGKHNPYALKNLSLKLYKGQVTALLGHNGAGKTTTMSILCGMIAPTSGYYNILTADEKDNLTDAIGVCPQHNILWDTLTIAEHILFYGQLRGMDRHLIVKEMEQFMRDVDLPLEKRDSLVKTLSGGMKRKLSVAIAFLGDTKTLVLDEPTAGVDPKARRDIWDMLINNKRDRTILLSTHHMEEADILGDRIAILSQGHLVCCGSSLFLKCLSGGTYFLTVEIREGTYSAAIVSAVEEIFKHVMYHQFQVRSVTNSQVVMELQSTDMDLFQDVCKCLDEMKKANEISSYGISAPTMEEVFLKLSTRHTNTGDETWDEDVRLASKGIDSLNKLDTIHEEYSTQKSDTPTTNSTTPVTPLAASSADSNFSDISFKQVPTHFRTSQIPLVPEDEKQNYNQGCRLYWQQFKALFIKRFHHAKRDKKGIFAQVVLPALFIALAMSINLAVPMSSNYEPRLLSMSMFSYPNYVPFEVRTPPEGYQGFDQSILRNEGVTYGDKFSRNVRAERERAFNLSEMFPSYIRDWSDSVDLVRDFVPQYPVCSIKYSMGKEEGEVPFPSRGFLTESGDVLINVTGNNLTEYLMVTQPEYKLARYCALTLDDNREDIIPEYSSPYTAKKNIVKTWFLNKGYHAQPTIINAMNNLQLRNAGSKHHISVAAQAMNNTARSTSHEYIMQGVPIVISIFIIAGLSFVPTSFVVYLVYERSSNAKHLQFCAGVRSEVYWISNYCWDMFNFLLPTGVSVIVFYVFQQEAFIESISAVILLILFYGFASTPMFYPASFIFNIPSAAYVTLLCSNLFIAVTTSYAVFTLERFPEDPTLTYYAHVMDKIFLIFPPYCLGKGFVDITYRYVMIVVYETMGIHTAAKTSVWEWNCLGRHLAVLPVTAVFWFIVTILIEKYLSRKKHVVRTIHTNTTLNDDVEAERQRALVAQNDILTVSGLTKRYKTYSIEHMIDYIRRKPCAKYSNVAVKNNTFGVKKGECFGLLGINGAGKTSTFNMLTGAAGVSAGEAWLGGQNIVTSLTQVQQLLGYCPQFDALINSLTGREMLTLFAALHGVPDPAASAASYVKELGLSKYADMQCTNFSGGNKRKLSAAIALVGSPKILLLDEPTAGMDPGARRQLWDVIRAAKRKGTSVLLTSHSMGECEVLCDRIAIMCKGTLQCVGTPHYLKQRYGSGYTATIKTVNTGLLTERIEEELQDVKLLEQHHNMVIYSLSQHARLTPLFTVLSTLRREGIVEDYSVSQCTLEDVFINFARNSENHDEDHFTELLNSSSTNPLSYTSPVQTY